jgi:glutathione-regulated potassium-efflux system ancillary protein KefF
VSRLLVIHAHPKPSQSVVTAALLGSLRQVSDSAIRSLYQLYPDFDIDVEAEQRALLAADLIVWLTPVYWYSVPSLMKHWIDQVLLHGWAYGQGAAALQGKACWWVCSVGAPMHEYSAEGMHRRPFANYVPPLEQTARFCGMDWLPPFVVHAGHSVAESERQTRCAALMEALRLHLVRLAGGGA